MPAPLSSTASPLALVPGDDRALEELAARLRRFAAGAAEAAGQLRDIQAGSWVGSAADAFRDQIGDLPRRLDRGADAFFAAERALDAHADALRDARQVAARAVDHWADGERATARWQAAVREHHRAEQSAAMTAAVTGLPATPVGPVPSSVDPGADDRALATRLLEGARDSVDASARAAARVLRDAAEAAPDEPSWLSRAAGQVGEFLAGAGEATWGMAVFAWKVSPTYALVDPEGFLQHGRGLVEGLVYGAQNPVEFAKAVVDWETWQENPARALGHLVPDLVLAVATAGAGAAATGGRRAAGAADDAAVLARAADRVEDAGDLAAGPARSRPPLQDPFAPPRPGDGPVHYNAVVNPGPLADEVANPWLGRQADNFRNGSYVGEVLEEPMVVHRYYGGPAKEAGPYWTPGLPQGPLQAQLGNAIKPEWNALTDVSVRVVPPGTTVYRGPAAPQTLGPWVPLEAGGAGYSSPGRLLGGDAQVLLPELPTSWGLRRGR